MNSITSSYITIISVSGVLSVLLALYAMMNKSHFAGMKAFVGVTVTSAIYTFGFALELASGSLEEIKFWLRLEYVGLALSPPFCLILVMHYTGMEKWLTRRTTGSLFLIPLITIVLVATNDYHHIFYQSIYLREGTPSPMADVIMGQWYIVHGSYTFGCLLAGVVLLIRQWRITTTAYRKQIATMMLGLMLPMIGSFSYLMGWTPYGMDPVPFILTVTSSLYIWAIRTTDMFNVVPIARGHVFESMRDGVLVLDLSDRLVDYNRAALRMIPELSGMGIGASFDKLWTSGSAPEAPQLKQQEGLQWVRRIRLSQGDEEIQYEVRSLPVQVRSGQSVGRMLMLIDVTESIRTEEKLRHMAEYDGLTGIYNRAHFMEETELLLKKAQEDNQPLSLILFDIDHFKKINDRLGHQAGDKALLHLVQVCRLHLKDQELFGRYGGEEFVVALPGSGLDDAHRLAEELRAAIAASPMYTLEGPVMLTASLGVAEADGANGYSLESLLQAADQALYRAKEGGRNMVRTAAPEGERNT
jgi:diguanylate cyclase (GGDEF)-like protein